MSRMRPESRSKLVGDGQQADHRFFIDLNSLLKS
jgi:hypothetical protein